MQQRKKWTQISYAIFRTAVPVPDRLLLAKKHSICYKKDRFLGRFNISTVRRILHNVSQTKKSKHHLYKTISNNSKYCSKHFNLASM
jgi:hypothetical protein